jgi:uncharacterized damage-inducible protein DinB
VAPGAPTHHLREALMQRSGVVRTVPAAVALLMAAAAARAQAAPDGFRGEFLHQFDYSMARVVALAEAVPAETYPRRATPGVMPLAQIFAHIARFNYEYPARAMGIAAPAGIDQDTLERVAEKERVLDLLRRSADHVRDAVRRMPEPQLGQTTTLYDRRVPQWAVLLQLLAHMDDHLGQSIAYARVNGVVPPWSR